MQSQKLYDQTFSVISENKPLLDCEFNELALSLFEHQFHNSKPYQNFCKGLNLTNPKYWTEIPCLSSEAFKTQKLYCGNYQEAAKVFVSSGTSQKDRSQHYLSADELSLYELSLWKSFSAAFKLSQANSHKTPCLLILTESPKEKPNSSLIHMFEIVRKKLFANNSVSNSLQKNNFVSEGELLLSPLIEALNKAIESQTPVLLVGTAFSFVHLLDKVNQRFCLPPGSALMETGGFKGKSREISKNDLYNALSELFGLPPQNIVGQYGMSELGIQFYDPCFTLDLSTPETRYKQAPHWARMRILDAQDLSKEVNIGEVGLICHYDLTNIDSCAFVLSGDLGIKRQDNYFELIGRASSLSRKGCSLNYDL